MKRKQSRKQRLLLKTGVLLALLPGVLCAGYMSTQSIEAGNACLEGAAIAAADQTKLLRSYIAADPTYLTGAVVTDRLYIYGSGVTTGAFQVFTGKGAVNDSHYVVVSIGGLCGCYTNHVLVSELRSAGPPVTALADISSGSLYGALVVCKLTADASGANISFTAPTESVQCATGQDNTDYFAQTAAYDDDIVRVVTSSATATSICSNLVTADIPSPP